MEPPARALNSFQLARQGVIPKTAKHLQIEQDRLAGRSSSPEKSQLVPKPEGKNLSQDQVDNPRVRVNGSIQIADGLFLGDKNSSHDVGFIKLNKVFRVVNCANTQIVNIFDREKAKTPEAAEILDKKGPSARKIVGTMKYLSFDWEPWEVPTEPNPLESKALRY